MNKTLALLLGTACVPVGYSYDLSITYKPAKNIQLSLGPAYNVSASLYQFVIDSRSTLYTVDADDAGSAVQPITFGEPDFNFRSLRANAVLRWEYRSGSTLYFVWQQNRSSSAPIGDFSFLARPDGAVRGAPGSHLSY